MTASTHPRKTGFWLQYRLRLIAGAVGLVLLVTLWLGVREATRPDIENLPNIIILVLDTVRQSATSLANPSAGTTPFLKKLAEKGIVFENAYATFDTTPESHFSIFTGLKKGFLTKKDREDQSLAYHLDDIGYDSVGVSGNYNVRKAAMRVLRPFDTFLSPANEQLSSLSPSLRNEILNDVSELISHFGAPSNLFNNSITACSAKAVNALLDEELRDIDPPALVFANFIDAHDPYLPPKPFHDEMNESPPEDFSSDLRSRPLPTWMENPDLIANSERRQHFLHRLKNVRNRKWNLSDDLSKASLALYEKRYKEEVAYLDSQIQQTFAILGKRGMLSKSLVIITSDHGESFGEKGYITHSMNNKGDKETTRHVPLLMIPTFIPGFSARRISEPVSITDIAPTVFDVVGIDDTPFAKAHGDLYGHSLVKYLVRMPGRKATHRAVLDTDNPSRDDHAHEALIKSLKALGYITEADASE